MSIKIKSNYTNYIDNKINGRQIDSKKKLVDRKVIPNYSLKQGYKMDKNMNIYDRFQTEALKTNYNLQRNPMGFANKNFNIPHEDHSKKQYNEENINEFYNDVQEEAKNVDLSDTSVNIEGGSIWSSILGGIKSLFPFLKKGVQTVAKNPSIIKDVIDTTKDIKEVIKPTVQKPDKSSLKDDEFLQMFRDGKITPDQYVKLTNTLKNPIKETIKPSIKPAFKPSKKPLNKITEDIEEDDEEKENLQSNEITEFSNKKSTKEKLKIMTKKDLLNYIENELKIDIKSLKNYNKTKLINFIINEMF